MSTRPSGPGRFGMADETGRLLNARHHGRRREGAWASASRWRPTSRTRQPPFAHVSVACASARLGIPLTAHVAIGTDIIHMHPAASGAAIGEGSLRDFRYFASNVAKLDRGVYLNCGSAVVLPEVFLKAVALARNRGIALAGLTTVNLDFMRLYRPQTNVVVRPPAGTGGKGYSLVGHHELLIPLLAAAMIEARVGTACRPAPATGRRGSRHRFRVASTSRAGVRSPVQLIRRGADRKRNSYPSFS